MDTNYDEPRTALEGGDEVPPTRSVFEAEAMGARLKAARGNLSQKHLAEIVGLHFNTIGKLERGYPPDTKMLLAIAKATDISAAWLLMGDPFPMRGFTPPSIEKDVERQVIKEDAAVLPAAALVAKSLQAIEVGAYVYVPHFDIQASAGPGFFNDVENIAAMRPFDRTYIRGKLGITHNELALVNIVGRSMDPLLKSGDVSLLDRRDRENGSEGIHVIRLDGALLVKSLQRMPGRVLRVSSKNPEYSTFDITPDEDNQRDFEVLGRLRWAGITLD